LALLAGPALFSLASILAGLALLAGVGSVARIALAASSLHGLQALDEAARL
jgi:hypothetical protein